MKSKAQNLVNRRARYDYELGKEYLAGLVLTGPEVSSIRQGRVSLKGAFITVKDAELWLNNMQISALATNAKALSSEDLSRPRKLLLKSKEIAELVKAKQNGETIIPTKLLNKSRYIKLAIASGKGKKTHDKRAVIKKRSQDRDIKRALRRH